MPTVEQVKIESDERGFELHLWIDQESVVAWRDGRIVLNIHSVVDELAEQVRSEIEPYLAEGRAAKREYDSGIADDPSQQEVLDRIKGQES